MKLRFRHTLILLLLAVMGSTLVSCQDEESGIGMDLQDPATLYQGQRDTLYGTGITLFEDSLMTTGYSLGLLGNISDGTFGSASATIFTQVTCSSETGFDYTTSTVDSVILSIVIDKGDYDTIGRGFSISVHRLAEEISSEQTYYGFDEIAVAEELFNGRVGLDTNYKGKNVISVKLNSSIHALFNGHRYTQQEFCSAMRGLRLTLNNTDTIVTVAFNDKDTKVSVFRTYVNSDNQSTVLQEGFSISAGARHFNHFEHNYISNLSIFNTNKKDSVDGASQMYLDPMGGTRVKLNFNNQIKAFHAAHPTAIVHYAELILPVDNTRSPKPADDLLAMRQDGDSTYLIYDMMDPFRSNGYDGKYHTGNGKYFYRLCVTQHLQKLLLQGKDEGTLLYINSRRASAKRSVLHGYSTAQKPHIVLVYSESK